MSDIIQQYHEEIVECLVKYGKISEADAKTLLERSGLLVDITDESIIFHEYPYFWAMNLLYGGTDPDWYRDPKLWPPPKDYMPRWRQDEKKE